MNERDTEKLKQLAARKQDIDAHIHRIRRKAIREEKRKEIRRRLLAGDFLYRLLGSDWKRVGERLKGESKLSEQDSELF